MMNDLKMLHPRSYRPHCHPVVTTDAQTADAAAVAAAGADIGVVVEAGAE